MKVRIGFVSNSSSSSYVLPKFVVNKEQIEHIVDHYNYSKILIKKHKFKKDQWGSYDVLGYLDEWNVTINDDYILLHTSMDNFDMHGFLELIGINEKYIIYAGEWGEPDPIFIENQLKWINKLFRKQKLKRILKNENEINK